MGDQPGLYSLAEAAELTGLSVEALRLRIKRGKLASERGNDGHPRVRLTAADRDTFRRIVGRRKPTENQQETDKTNAVKALEEAVGILNEQLGREQAEINRLRIELETVQAAWIEARERAARAEGEAVSLRGAVDRETARTEREAAVRQAAEARAARDGARADLETAARRAAEVELAGWTAGGPLARAWRAFFRGRS
jgi:hypothetical protein